MNRLKPLETKMIRNLYHEQLKIEIIADRSPADSLARGRAHLPSPLSRQIPFSNQAGLLLFNYDHLRPLKMKMIVDALAVPKQADSQRKD